MWGVNTVLIMASLTASLGCYSSKILDLFNYFSLVEVAREKKKKTNANFLASIYNGFPND